MARIQLENPALDKSQNKLQIRTSYPESKLTK